MSSIYVVLALCINFCSSEEVPPEISPYLIPREHPSITALDEVFSDSSVIMSIDSLKNSEFTVIQEGLIAHTVKHPSINHIIIKVITDDMKGENVEWEHFLKRIKGAEIIRKAIKKCKYHKIMKVPNKWIYKLSEKSPEGIEYILVAEDMNILSEENCKKCYFHRTKKEHLNALYHLVTTYGLSDSCNPQNIPWCKDGRIAFVDTEHHNTWPIQYHYINKWLSKKKCKYWNSLIKNKGAH